MMIAIRRYSLIQLFRLERKTYLKVSIHIDDILILDLLEKDDENQNKQKIFLKSRSVFDEWKEDSK